ncbi:AAA family ATPase [Microbacterium sp. NPDC089696]|uniref:AAA family ATPase n=1 Tax=Microbacterium sp. NPDC089696 TaxID=3364199 RepID=UPI0037F49549
MSPVTTIVSGLPGVGKTTVARALAGSVPRGVLLDSDAVGEGFIVSGLVLPGGTPAPESERQLSLRRRNLCVLAANFAAEGFEVFISDVVLWPALLASYRAAIPGELRFVLLTAGESTIAARDSARDKQVADAWSHLRADQDAWNSPGLRLDTSELTVDATIDAVQRGKSDSRLPSSLV